MEVFKGDTVYMTFPHTRSGAVRSDWTFRLVVDGVFRQDVAIDILEVAPFIYTASFINNGTDNQNWTLYAIDAEDVNFEYIESWKIRTRQIENSVMQIRSRQDSEGGFFKTSYDIPEK